MSWNPKIHHEFPDDQHELLLDRLNPHNREGKYLGPQAPVGEERQELILLSIHKLLWTLVKDLDTEERAPYAQ